MSKSMHMLVEADYICDLAIQAYNFEENEEWAIKLLKEGFAGITDELVTKILEGDAKLTGWGICDDKKCDQCKGLKPVTLVEKSDKKLKTKIQNNKLQNNKNYFKVGQFLINKELVVEYAKVRLLYNNQDGKLFQNEMEMVRNNFWSTTNHRRPNERYIPEESSIHYKFNEIIVPFIDDITDRIDNLIPKDSRMIPSLIEELEKEYGIIKEELKSEFRPKPIRAEGCILVTVYDNNDEPRYFNLEKAMYLQYIDARQSSFRKQKITMSQDVEKEKVMKRFEQYEKTIGYAHKAMMESMNLMHSESGYYNAQTHPVEHDVNGLLQWYMWHVSFDNDDREITSLPNELMLSANGDAYVDGKLVEERIDLR